MKVTTKVKVDVRLPSGNLYPKKVMQKAIDEYMQRDESIRFGCLGDEQNTEVELSKASHIVKDVTIEDDMVVADIKILQTPAGDDLQRLIDAKIPLNYSPRGMGSVNEYAGDKVQDDYLIISIDCIGPYGV
jgi:hypothetical protein